MTTYQEHLTFMKGWSDAAGQRSMDVDLVGKERDIYDQGFLSGQSALLRARKVDLKAREFKMRPIISQQS